MSTSDFRSARKKSKSTSLNTHRDKVKTAAAGRWAEIITALCPVDPGCLDGRHHACPKSCHPDAGGKDRFRALKDFDETGGVICNQCFSSGNADGFSTIAWLTDCDVKQDFPKILAAVAKHLRVQKPKSKKTKRDPADSIDELTWSRTAATLWAQSKPPINLAAIERLGARYAKHLIYTVIAIPVWGPTLDAAPPVGWVMYRSDGRDLPVHRGKGVDPDWVKVKVAAGSTPGLIACLEDWKAIGTDTAPRTWWKLEGSTDLLAALSSDWPAGHAFFTTANGAKEKPLDWILKSLEGCQVNVCHDADAPGQTGATWVEQSAGNRRPGWCPMLAKASAEVRNVCLPFAVEPNHGPDIRDFLKGGGTPATLIEIAEAAAVWESNEAEETECSVLYLDAEDTVAAKVSRLTDLIIQTSSLYRTGNQLVAFRDQQSRFLADADALIGFASEFFEVARRTEDRPDTFFPLPVQYAKCWRHNSRETRRLPEINMLTSVPVFNLSWEISQPGYHNGIYYCGDAIEPSESCETIDTILADFCFSSPADRTNYIGMLLTCCLMPHFTMGDKAGLLLNGNQPSIGKSYLAQILAIVKENSVGDTVSYNPNDEEFEKSLGSIVQAGATTIIIDNVKLGKGKEIASACLERSMTDTILSYRLLKTSTRIRVPNCHIFVITANAAEIGGDLRTRFVLVGLHFEGDPKLRKCKIADPRRYAIEHRKQLIAELLGMIKKWKDAGSPPSDVPARFGAWGETIGGILDCCGEPDFLANANELEKLDTDKNDFDELVAILYRHPSSKGWTATELVEIAQKNKLFAASIFNGVSRSNTTKMGILCTMFIGSEFAVDGVAVTFQSRDNGKTKEYKVRDLAGLNAEPPDLATKIPNLLI